MREREAVAATWDRRGDRIRNDGELGVAAALCPMRGCRCCQRSSMRQAGAHYLMRWGAVRILWRRLGVVFSLEGRRKAHLAVLGNWRDLP